MQSKDQPLQIYKWNSVFGFDIIVDHLNIINTGFVLMTWAIALLG
jgi:hypothetical protein